VPGVGIEPTSPFGRGLLRPLRQPIAPPGRYLGNATRETGIHASALRGGLKVTSRVGERTE
jgi:hypothetical protein